MFIFSFQRVSNFLILFLTEFLISIYGQSFYFENSQHPYLPLTTEFSTFLAPVGVIWWSLSFDSSTYTESGYDFLILHKGSLNGTAVYTNSGNMWPTINITCSDGLVAEFKSDLNIQSWGVKM